MSYRISGDGVLHIPTSQWFTKEDEEHWTVYTQWLKNGGIVEPETLPGQSFENMQQLRRDLYVQEVDCRVIEATLAAYCGDDEKYKMLMDQAVKHRQQIQALYPYAKGFGN